ncbi:cytochrome C [Shewanella glacialipiscicola]|uniref:multiheme c-type cytochrome n=1 Tax=Shewanella glacialipiscicola TaxID=614069 RepID=UPI0021DA89FD|nr:cytochrome C [Shewanella glacialipiscicola]MCU7994689.1 cytochrome C [Shewanella glacialipiscicola]MCU8026160.1 cytochrome C [Shewanella glacialipiscicola]
MKIFTSKKLAYLVALALTGALVGCGSDGDDGAPGAPGIPGTPGVPGAPGGPGTPPPVTNSTMTNVKVINYSFEEGSISYEFEVTDENNNPIKGLLNAQAKVAALTDKGFITNRTEADKNGIVDNVYIGGEGTQATTGAELTALADGHYQFKVPMKGVNPSTEGIVWLRVGGNDGIATSKPLVVNKPEGTHSTTTDSCYSCHVDYATSPRRHASYVATGMDSEVTFVEGCLVCHGSVSRAIVNAEGFSTGSYATNTLSKIGHINHQDFTKDFSVQNCTSCHVEAPKNINVAGPGCIDCHDSGGVPGAVIPSNGADLRILHESKAGITERKAIRAKYKLELSTPVKVADISVKTDHFIDGTAAAKTEPGWCTTLTVKDVDGNIFSIKDNFNYTTVFNPAKPIVYAGAYLHAYDNGSLVGRPGERAKYYYGYNTDGTKNICHLLTNISAVNANYAYSARVTFSTAGWMEYDGNARYYSNGSLRATGYDGSMGVSFTAYSDVVNPTTELKVSGFERREIVSATSCTTCHNDATAFHKNGAFDEGGKACIACHDNGMERTSAAIGAGFGPMVHSWHWGNGANVGEVKADGTQAKTANGAGAIEASTSCVACHTKAIDLDSIPNQYIAEPGSKMTSPVTANCYACHTSDSAKAHMATNGGEISVPKVADWFKQPTSESCAVCHDTGKSSGIDKYHKFTR